jgi:hypothetical protein
MDPEIEDQVLSSMSSSQSSSDLAWRRERSALNSVISQGSVKTAKLFG